MKHVKKYDDLRVSWALGKCCLLYKSLQYVPASICQAVQSALPPSQASKTTTWVNKPVLKTEEQTTYYSQTM